MRSVLSDPALADALSDNGLKAIAERHTCRHRADELLETWRGIKGDIAVPVHTSEAA